MTMYKKSAKVYLILLYFIFRTVHTDGLNKHIWIEVQKN